MNKVGLPTDRPLTEEEYRIAITAIAQETPTPVNTQKPKPAPKSKHE